MAKKRLVKIALGQFESIQGDTQANLNKMLSMTDQAAEAGADLIVFPEHAYSGYFCPSYQMQQLAEPKDGPFVQQMCKKAERKTHPHHCRLSRGNGCTWKNVQLSDFHR